MILIKYAGKSIAKKICPSLVKKNPPDHQKVINELEAHVKLHMRKPQYLDAKLIGKYFASVISQSKDNSFHDIIVSINKHLERDFHCGHCLGFMALQFIRLSPFLIDRPLLIQDQLFPRDEYRRCLNSLKQISIQEKREYVNNLNKILRLRDANEWGIYDLHEKAILMELDMNEAISKNNLYIKSACLESANKLLADINQKLIDGMMYEIYIALVFHVLKNTFKAFSDENILNNIDILEYIYIKNSSLISIDKGIKEIIEESGRNDVKRKLRDIYTNNIMSKSPSGRVLPEIHAPNPHSDEIIEPEIHEYTINIKRSNTKSSMGLDTYKINLHRNLRERGPSGRL